MRCRPRIGRAEVAGWQGGPRQSRIDEVRAIKYELSARFDHDIDRLGAHLKAVQEDIARRDPQRIIRLPGQQQ